MSRIPPPALTILVMLILVPVLLLVPPCLLAIEDNPEELLYLEADSAEIFEAIALSIYKGNVIIRHSTMEIRGDQVTVHHDLERRPELIVVIGTPATYLQQKQGEEKNIKATALHVEYNRARDEVTLIDQAVVFQGGDTFRNDCIVYDRAQARIKAGVFTQGKERVKIRISPSR